MLNYNECDSACSILDEKEYRYVFGVEFNVVDEGDGANWDVVDGADGVDGKCDRTGQMMGPPQWLMKGMMVVGCIG